MTLGAELDGEAEVGRDAAEEAAEDTLIEEAAADWPQRDLLGVVS